MGRLNRSDEPIFNVPGSVVAVLAVMTGVHAVRSLLPPDDELWLTFAMAFIPARYAGYADQLPGGDLASFTSFITHMFVHGDLTHLIFNSAWMLAFGGAIALRMGAGRFLGLAGLCGVVGAVLFLIINPGLAVPVVGASGAVSGLMGAAMRFLFSAMDMGGVWMLREAPKMVPAMSLATALRDKRIIAVTLIWLGLNFLALFGFGGVEAPGGIAWEAHVGGYLAGFFAFGLFDPGIRSRAPVNSPDRPTFH